MKQHFQSLRVASGKELEEEERCIEFIKACTDEKFDSGPENVQTPQNAISQPSPDALPNGETVHLDSLKPLLTAEADAINCKGSGGAGGILNAVSCSEHKDINKKPERKRGKAEKTISLEVLQQYFAGSLKDAAKSLGAEVVLDQRGPEGPECGWTNAMQSEPVPKEATAAPPDSKLQFLARLEVKTVTVKASYREGIIRFRLSVDAGILRLKEEVAKRLKLDRGTFDIKYLDDDHEWVLIACDANLQECLDVLGSSGSNIIGLLVQDVMANLGSFCESSGE